MKNVPRISDAEWEVMWAIWESAQPLTSQEIIDAVAHERKWNPNTVRTLINRLAAKKAIVFEKEGRVYRYHALVTKEACVRAASQSFLDRVFGGALEPMLAHFVREKRLSKSEISELKKLLEHKQ